jgi:hypothetical protein
VPHWQPDSLRQLSLVSMMPTTLLETRTQLPQVVALVGVVAGEEVVAVRQRRQQQPLQTPTTHRIKAMMRLPVAAVVVAAVAIM